MEKTERYYDFRDFRSLCRGLWKNESETLEKEFAGYLGVSYAIGTSYGRTALYLGLRAIGCRGVEVILPSFTCAVVRQAVVMAGASPRFVDIDSESFNFDLEDLERKISANTKAIVLTHYFGGVASNLEEVVRISRENNLVMIEDCAHCLGAEYKGKKIGTLGDFSFFSLTKNMINFGGGILATNEKKIFYAARDLLEKERRSKAERVADFPIVFAYGLGQAIEKLIHGRMLRRKRLLSKLPGAILTLRSYLLRIIRFPLNLKTNRYSKNLKVYEKAPTTHGGGESLSYGQDIHMASIIAALGRSQLKKLDALIEQRRRIHGEVCSLPAANCYGNQLYDTQAAFTFLVIRTENNDVYEMQERCRKMGIELKATWPTHQKMWDSQETENILRIKKEIMLWNINPGLPRQEVRKFIQVISEVSGSPRSPEGSVARGEYATRRL